MIETLTIIEADDLSTELLDAYVYAQHQILSNAQYDSYNVVEDNIHVFNNAMMQSYLLVGFPEIQTLMGEPWFNLECKLYHPEPDEKGMYSTYFVPVHRILQYQINNTK